MINGYPLFFHWHPAKLKGIGPMGHWFELIDGSTTLMPSDGSKEKCYGVSPVRADGPCERCGWTPKYRKEK